MFTTAEGRLGRVVYAHLDREADLYDSIVGVAKKHRIETGVVLSITGALSAGRMTISARDESGNPVPRPFEWSGFSEVSGHGILGQTIDSWGSEAEGIHYKAGDPYIHVHLSATWNNESFTGHLVTGCRVRSVHPVSHFTIVLAEVEGLNLEFRCSEETAPHYPQGVPIHRLRQA